MGRARQGHQFSITRSQTRAFSHTLTNACLLTHLQRMPLILEVPAPSEPPAASVTMPKGAVGLVVFGERLKTLRQDETIAGNSQP